MSWAILIFTRWDLWRIIFHSPRMICPRRVFSNGFSNWQLLTDKVRPNEDQVTCLCFVQSFAAAGCSLKIHPFKVKSLLEEMSTTIAVGIVIDNRSPYKQENINIKLTNTTIIIAIAAGITIYHTSGKFQVIGPSGNHQSPLACRSPHKCKNTIQKATSFGFAISKSEKGHKAKVAGQDSAEIVCQQGPCLVLPC